MSNDKKKTYSLKTNAQVIRRQWLLRRGRKAVVDGNMVIFNQTVAERFVSEFLMTELAAKKSQEIAPSLDRTLNRHRWINRVYLALEDDVDESAKCFNFG